MIETVASWWMWAGFVAFVVAMIAVDMYFLQARGSHKVSVREAAAWSAVWVLLALAFNAWFWWYLDGSVGREIANDKALEFLTGYLIEKSLSVDNLFVFLLVFAYFGVKPELQHKVLFWGILGALVMRLAFILAGVALLERFHWLIFVFGGILIYSGIKLWSEKDKKVEPEKNPVIKTFRRFVPVLDRYEGEKFFVRHQGRRFATPLFIVLLFVETTDLIFAVDSIPAVLAITRDPFIVYTSNAFAILGLRALYFALAGVMQMFHHLHYGLAATLVFVGGKMVASEWVKIPTWISLTVVMLLIGVSVWASLRWPASAPARPGEGVAPSA